MNRTWQDNADEFAELDRGDGWPFAVLVACSVEKGAGEGGRHDHRNDRYGDKTSASVFAERAGTSAPRVLRFLEAWNAIAQDEPDMKAAADLAPGDVFTSWHPDVPWKDVYRVPADKPSGGRPRDSKPEDAAKIIERRGAADVVKAMPTAYRKEMIRELHTSEPDAYRAEQERAAHKDGDATGPVGTLQIMADLKFSHRQIQIIKEKYAGRAIRLDLRDGREMAEKIKAEALEVIELMDLILTGADGADDELRKILEQGK